MYQYDSEAEILCNEDGEPCEKGNMMHYCCTWGFCKQNERLLDMSISHGVRLFDATITTAYDRVEQLLTYGWLALFLLRNRHTAYIHLP